MYATKLVFLTMETLLEFHKILCKLYLQGDLEEDEMVPDKASDIRPRFHRARTHSISKCSEEVSFNLVQ